jgi:preprotein translocase subunit SecG
MVTAIISIHVLVCILLILIILLQSGKGATMGASFGAGSSQTLFGPAGPAGLLTKITTAVAIIFMITSLTLAMLSGRVSDNSVMKDIPAEKAPIEKTLTENNIDQPVTQPSEQVPAEAKPIKSKTE